MRNSLNAAKTLPLTILFFGTSLLAIPAVALTVLLLVVLCEWSDDKWSLLMMLFAPIAGFALLFGYFRAYRLKKYNQVFWLLSTLYNFTLSGFILFLLLSQSISSSEEMNQILQNMWRNPAYPFLLWTIFVTVASGYYCKFAYANKRYTVPTTKATATAIDEKLSLFSP